MEALTGSERAAFCRDLACWFADAQRPLPWRLRPGVYETVVSEFMAQQTRIETMLPYYSRWMSRFPSFDALAGALVDEVLRHWEGLGYYSRARNLHRLAQSYVSLPVKPMTPEQWQQLPGVGSYTAAAVSSIAQGYPVAVVDGNVVRVLARLTGDARVFSSGTEAVKAFGAPADALLDHEHPGRHNQAMMELGAVVCVRGRPLCQACPVRRFCVAAERGDACDLPKIVRPATERVTVDRVLCVRDAAVLLYRAPEDSARLAGQYELPLASHLDWTPAGEPLVSRFRSITRYRIRERFYELPKDYHLDLQVHPYLNFLSVRELRSVTLSGPHRRLLRELLCD